MIDKNEIREGNILINEVYTPYGDSEFVDPVALHFFKVKPDHIESIKSGYNRYDPVKLSTEKINVCGFLKIKKANALEIIKM